MIFSLSVKDLELENFTLENKKLAAELELVQLKKELIMSTIRKNEAKTLYYQHKMSKLGYEF